MTLPVLFAFDENAADLSPIAHELEDRYGRHYRVVCTDSPDEARGQLEELADAGVAVAGILAGQWQAASPASACWRPLTISTRRPSVPC